MRAYTYNKFNCKGCYTNDKPGIEFFNWSLYEHSSIDNSMDALSAKQSIYEKQKVSKKSENWKIAYTSPKPISNIELQFNILSEKWQEETGLYSITKQKVNDTFLEIISMGKDIIPFILRELKSPYSTASWHLALKALARFSPVSEQELGDSDIVKQKWIEWGGNIGLV